MSLLGLMIWAPIAAGFAALLLKDPDVVRRWALAASLFVFVLAVVAALGLRPGGRLPVAVPDSDGSRPSTSITTWVLTACRYRWWFSPLSSAYSPS